MACAMVAQTSDLRRPVVPGLDRHHAGVAENQSREIASSASDKFAPTDTGKSEDAANRGVGERSAAAVLRVRGSSPKAKTRKGLRKPPQAARRARPEGRRPNPLKRRSELQMKK